MSYRRSLHFVSTITSPNVRRRPGFYGRRSILTRPPPPDRCHPCDTRIRTRMEPPADELEPRSMFRPCQWRDAAKRDLECRTRLVEIAIRSRYQPRSPLPPLRKCTQTSQGYLPSLRSLENRVRPGATGLAQRMRGGSNEAFRRRRKRCRQEAAPGRCEDASVAGLIGYPITMIFGRPTPGRRRLRAQQTSSGFGASFPDASVNPRRIRLEGNGRKTARTIGPDSRPNWATKMSVNRCFETICREFTRFRGRDPSPRLTHS